MKILQLSMAVLFALLSINSWAFEYKATPVVNNVYALVGDTGPRTEANHGLNNTLGFIVTENSVILVGSGTNVDAYREITRAMKQVTDKPIRHVINIGTQDHHWMGNYYFAKAGADIIALKKTVESQKENVDSQLTRLEHDIKDQIKSVKPQHANHVIDSNHYEGEIDGIKFVILWPGKGHFGGDAVLWLPESKTAFTGDLVFMDRILGIHPTSDVVAWRDSFDEMAKLKPEHIIPGHGRPTDLAGAKHDTGNYLNWLVTNVKAAQDDWKEMEDTINSLADAPQFKHLEHYDGWHRRNIHQTFLQLESK